MPRTNPNAENLDGFADADELTEWAKKLKRAPRAVRRYAEYKAWAMRARHDGRIAEAMRCEAECERLYVNLIPRTWRW